jgi:hypothetical protein
MFVGAFAVVKLAKLPDVLHAFCIGVGFTGETEEPLSIIVRKPDGTTWLTFDLKKTEKLIDQPFEFVMAGAMIPNLEFNEDGVYQIVLQEGSTPIHEMPFWVTVQENSPEG